MKALSFTCIYVHVHVVFFVSLCRGSLTLADLLVRPPVLLLYMYMTMIVLCMFRESILSV